MVAGSTGPDGMNTEARFPEPTDIEWANAYRLALPFAVGFEDVRFHPAFDEVIRYTSPANRIRSGTLPERYGVSGHSNIDEAILSPFTTLAESLFSDGSFGVCYLTKEKHVAIQEMADRISSIMIASRARYAEVEFVVVDMKVSGAFHDYYSDASADLLTPESDYHNIGRVLRTEESDGILFPNHSGEEPTPCLAVFNADTLSVNECSERVILTWREGQFIGYSFKTPMIALDESY